MPERIMVTGSNGYLGNPLMLELGIQTNKQISVMGIDNGDRERWVQQIGGKSLTQYDKALYFNANLQDLASVINILNYFRPTIIIHLASQPSGPYSEISYQHRIGTQINNLTILMNLLNCVHDLGMDTRFVVATSTGVPGSPNGSIEETHSPNCAGSSYHVSRGFDSANLQLAAKQWKMRILELRTSIVYGTRIDSFKSPITRLDFDYWFGTVIHRFAFASKANIPIKIYGKGLQEKPFISLNDCIKSFVNSISYDIKPGHEIMNQTTHCLSVVTAAELCKGDITHIPNPRVENEEYKMVIKNEKFLKLLDSKSPTKDSIQNEINTIKQDIDLNLLPINSQYAYDGILTPMRPA